MADPYEPEALSEVMAEIGSRRHVDLDELCTRSGVCGTLADAYGVYSDPSVGAFMHNVALKGRTPR